MTVAVAVKVYDGVVLAADSATTIPLGGSLGHQVYNSANKVFQLHRHEAVGAMTWGLGQIGSASIATLAKDLRRRFMGADPAHTDWALQPGYTIEGVAERLIEMMFDELYSVELNGRPPSPEIVLGFLVAGYSHGGTQAEMWGVLMTDPATCPSPVCLAGPDQYGWISHAQPEATNRLFHGYDPSLPAVLAPSIAAGKDMDVKAALDSLETTVVQASMPFADAIHLARFMVDVTIGYRRFAMGPDTVGGPVEIAGISRHERFKWISRKHYYSPELNPEDPHP